MRFGSAYGHFVIHCTPFLPPMREPGPKTEGYDSTGSAKMPPDNELVESIQNPHMHHTEYRTYDNADVERHRKNNESSALVLLFFDDFGDHGSHDSNISIQ